MWGNLTGWIISAMMLLITAAVLYQAAQPPQESQPANLIPDAFKPIALPVNPDTVAPPATQDCDATELYQQAIETYLKDPHSYENAGSKSTSELPALRIILQAADCGRMHLFDLRPQQVINYNDHKPWVEALLALGEASNNFGLRLRDDKPREAEKYYLAAFALGERLFREAVTWQEMSAGLSLMSMSARSLMDLSKRANDTARFDVLQHFQEQTDTYRIHLQQEVASPLGNPVESYAWKFAGDVFAVAKDPEAPRIWRVEAILHLGRYRWNVEDRRKADQFWADRELHVLETDPNPKNQELIIHTAIKTAEAMTREQQQNTASGG